MNLEFPIKGENYYLRPGASLNVNIGCRNKPLPNFCNLDINPNNKNADVIDDGVELSKFEDGSVNRIDAIHMLEHADNTTFLYALHNWFRKLKHGGELVLSVPDIERVSALLLLTKSKNIVKSLFYGSQNDGDPWDFHRSMHTRDSLTQDLYGVGFQKVEEWNYWEKPPYDYVDTFASAVYPHMLKKSKQDNGREIDLGGIQLSLNLCAIK